MKEDNWFPIKIIISDSGEVLICKTPEDVPNGISFKVIETKVKI